MNNSSFVHPLLFAIFPILSILSANITETEPVSALKPAVFSVLATGLVLLLLVFLFKDAHKGALATSLLLALFFTYGHANNILEGVELVSTDRTALAILGTWVALCVFGMVGIINTKRDLAVTTYVLNMVAIFVLITPIIFIVRHELAENDAQIDLGPTLRQFEAQAAESPVRKKPDIYYLIFDRYSSARELKRVVDFDNTDFTDYLKNSGFYVANRSRTNYSRTYLSLASSLNMKYHDRFFSRRASQGLLHDSSVRRFVKAMGYKYVHFESRYPLTRNNPFADVNVPTSRRKIDPFAQLVLDTTLAKLVVNKLYPLEREEQTLLQLSLLSKARDIPGPKFVFAHVLVPHDPYLFDRDGRRVSATALAQKPEIELYKDYILFLNTKIQNIVDALTADPKNLPIIIIQADEGFRPGAKWRAEHRLGHELHFGILNSYFLPGVDARKILYDSITPVNSFRVIFNTYFGTDFKLLKDENFLAPLNENTHSLKKFTNSLK